ncbi:MAG: hypothetical protein U1E76_21355 [Planctomycetota bacterium]
MARFADRPWLEDARQYTSFLTDVRRDYHRLALADVFPTLGAMFEAGEAVQARSARAQLEALRQNPNLSGYVFTQFQDCSWECSAGIVDVWQEPKRVFATLRDMNRDLLVLDVKHRCAFLPATFTADLLLVREHPRAGKGLLRLRVTDALGSLLYDSGSRPIEAGAEPITMLARDLRWSTDQAGRYAWQASIATDDEHDELPICATQQALYVAPAPAEEHLAVTTIGDLRRAGLLLDAAQIERGADHDVIVAGALGDLWLDAAAFACALDLLDAARTGRRILFLAPPPADSPLASLGLIGSMQRTSARGSFVGKFHFARAELPYFTSLPVQGFLGAEFATVDPDFCLGGWNDQGVAAGVIEAPGKYLGADLATVQLGTGRLVFSTFRLLDAERDDAVAVTLLGNLVRALSRELTGGAATIPPAPLTRAQMLEQYRAARAARMPFWVAGPFASDEQRTGFDRAFAPEAAAFQPDANWHRVSVAPREALDFVQVLGPAEHSVAYAVTFVQVATERAAILATGSDDGLKLWLNGEQVLGRRALRTLVRGEDQTDVMLRAGWNELRAKVDNVAGAWRFALDILTLDGQPMKDVRFALEPRD